MMINKRLINMTKSSKKYMILCVVYQWISLLCNIVSICAIAVLLQNMLQGNFEKTVMSGVAITVVIMIVIRTWCNVKAAEMSYKSSTEIKDKLRELIYSKLLKLGNRYNQTVSTSEVVQVSVEGVEQLEIYMGRYLPQFFYSLLAPFTLFVVIAPINFKAAIVLLLCVPFIPMSIVAVQKFAKKLLSKYWSQYTGLGDHFLENLSGLTTLKIYNADEDKHKQMNEEAETFRKVTMKVLTMQLNSVSIMDLLAFGGAAIGCIIAILEMKAGKIEFYQAFMIIMLAAEFFIPLRLLGSFFHIAMNGMAASDKIFALLDAQEDPVAKGDKNITDLTITLDQVSFGYEEKEVLKEVSMKVPEGSFHALVGVSGSGKSTIASLLMGEHTPAKGAITIGGIPFAEFSEAKRMEAITYVSFQSYLFAGTVRENLLLGNENATEEMLYEGLKRVNLYDFVMEQGGLDMEVKEQGNNLSGGQKQRLAMARAFLHDSPCYIFDEATSNIDVESEEAILEAILSLKGNKTVLFITHRLSQVKKADCIHVLEKGSVKESGSFTELCEKKGIFANMYETQAELERYREGGIKNA